MTVRVINRSILCVFATTLALLFCGVSSALALSPWWHLTSGSRPTHIQSGIARDEVQEISVGATGGEAFLIGPSGSFARFKWDAEDAEVREALEELYGKGNIEVTGGPGDATGSKPYVVTFIGELADQSVESINAIFSLSFLECDAGAGPDCTKEAIVTEKTKGRADGEIAVTAANLGDANVNGEPTPVTVTDSVALPTSSVASTRMVWAA